MPARLLIKRPTFRIFLLACISFLILSIQSCKDGVRKKEIESPDVTFGVLFKDVQMAAVFPDSKTFADCVPIETPAEILTAYGKEKDRTGFNLKEFVETHFEIPGTNGKEFVSDTSLTAEEHITKLWPILERKPYSDGGTLIPLRKIYIVPGGRFREVYYWDSYFTMLGLAATGKDSTIDDMVVNFAQLIQDFDHIPSGNRSYYLSRSQPPFFASMVSLLAKVNKDEETLIRFLPQIQKEYQYWMGALDREEAAKQEKLRTAGEKAYKKVVFIEEEQVLNRYCDELATPRPEAYKEDIETAAKSSQPDSVTYRHLRSGAESGWDYSSRWLKDPMDLSTIHTTDIIPVGLNALLFNMEKVLEEIYRLKEETYYADNYKTLSEKRKAMLDKYCWNEEKGFYFDYDFVAGKQKEIYSLAAVYPLFFNMASQSQAERVAEVIERDFLQVGGLPATLSNTGEQWDGPHGWAPLQYMSIMGLRNYGLTELASKIKNRWVANNLRVYKNTGKMVEKYNVYDLSLLAGGGEYPVQDGFGWTNGVLLKLLKED